MEATPTEGFWEGLECDWDESHRPTEAALAQGKLLLAAARAAQVEPEDAGVGYWPTLCLFWCSGGLEVEVFEDSYDLHVIASPASRGSLDIRSFRPGSESALASLIKKLQNQIEAAE